MTARKFPGKDDPHSAEYQWKLIVVGKRKTESSLEWVQEENYKLGWNDMKEHSLKVVLLNVASKMVLSGGGPSGLTVEKLELSPQGKLVEPAKTVFWEIETVGHSFSPGEKKAAIVGGVFGGAAVVGIGIIGVVTAGAGIVALAGAGGAAAAAGGTSAASGSFIAGSIASGSFIAGGTAAAAGTGTAAATAATVVGATGTALTAGGVIGALGTLIITEGAKALKASAVLALGAIEDEKEGLADPEKTEEKQLLYIAMMIKEANL